MNDQTLGRLTPVELRDIWSSEASDFTPWLAREENLSVLGEALGVELELEAQEQAVGPFRADILCKEVTAHPPASGFEVFVTVGERSGMWLSGMVCGWGSLMVTGG